MGEFLLYYFGALSGIVVIFYTCRKFCFKRRKWGENR